MAVILNASTSSGLVQTADTSGEIVLQNNGTTRLTVNASGVTIPTLIATTVQGTIVQGTAVASTSGTSIDFTGIPSWAKRITVMFSGVSTSGTSNIQIQLGTGNTTYTTTGYASTSWNSDAGSGSATTGLLIANSVAAGNIRQGAVVITNLTGNVWVNQGSVARTDSAVASVCAGSVSLSAVLTAVRITTVNGTDTFDAGSINIQYEG
jgi:hypothetical protein